MIFSFILIDKPDAGDLRQRIRPEHKAYLAVVAERMAFAGPLVADDGQTMLGAGLYASVTIHAFVNLWPQRAGFAPAA